MPSSRETVLSTADPGPALWEAPVEIAVTAAREPEFESQIKHLLSSVPSNKLLVALGLNFLICKIGMIKISISKVVGIKIKNTCKMIKAEPSIW